MWVTVFERLGPGAAILIFVGACLWKLLPPMLNLLSAWKMQSDVITTSLPRFEGEFRRVTDTVVGAVVRIEGKLDRILPPAAREAVGDAAPQETVC